MLTVITSLVVGAIGIGQFPIPGMAKPMVAPGPLFFTGYQVMVGYMQHAGLLPVIVITHEIEIGMIGHERGGPGVYNAVRSPPGGDRRGSPQRRWKRLWKRALGRGSKRARAVPVSVLHCFLCNPTKCCKQSAW